jgi:hypothetical protein
MLGRGTAFLTLPLDGDRVYCYWVRAQTHRRDHTRYLPPTIRDNVLRFLGRRIFHANYRPLLDQP